VAVSDVAGAGAGYVVGGFLLVAAALPTLAVWLSVKWSRAWRGGWRAAALLPVIVLGAWTVTLFLSWPDEHTLWPFELLVLGVPLAVYILIVRGIRALVCGGVNGAQPNIL